MTHYMSDTIQMGQDSSTNKEKEEVEKTHGDEKESASFNLRTSSP